MRSPYRLAVASSNSAAANASVARLFAHLSTPLYRNGYALIVSSATTSVLGAVYWILAARAYSAAALGLNAAAISAMMFLGGASQLNLSSALIRFIPAAGRSTGRFVAAAYLVSVLVAVVISLGARELARWMPALSFLGASPFFSQVFMISTMAWTIFVLQDSVLTGLRRATWVPFENVAFSVVKVVLLICFAKTIPQYGVFASWVIAMALTLLPVNTLIFRRLIPHHVSATHDRATPLIPRQVVSYVAVDYVGALCWLASTTLLPIMVTQHAGATVNAYFYLAWQIAYALYFVSPSMGSSLIVEVVNDPVKLGLYSYRVFVNTMRIVVPMAVLVALGAPYILALFGHAYVAQGTMLLRLLALSAIPHIATSLYISIARVQRRVAAATTVLGALCLLVLTLGYFLLRIYGISGIGLAWLAGQLLIAAVLLATQLRPLWSPLRHSGKRERDLDLRLTGRLSSYGVRVQQRSHWVAVELGLLPLLHRLREHRGKRRRLQAAGTLLPRILPAIAAPPDLPLPATWTALQVVSTLSDMTVVTVGPAGRAPAALLKLPQSGAALQSLRRETHVLAALRADPRLGDWSTLLPSRLHTGEVDEQAYVVEQMVPGCDARRVLHDAAACMRMQCAAAVAIGELHRRTACPAVVDAARLVRWIDEPLQAVHGALATLPRAAGNDAAIEGLAAELRGALAGRTLPLSCVHGDFTPGNILVTPDGATLTGIVDWDQSTPDDLPLLDLGLLLLSTRTAVQRRELGEVVAALLAGECWTPHEQNLLSAAERRLPGSIVELRTMVLLCWLRHVAANLTKAQRYRGHRLWMANNVEAVLQQLYVRSYTRRSSLPAVADGMSRPRESA